MGTLNQLEDRVLVLRDKVDSAVLKAGFKTDQTRDYHGRWGEGGGATGKGPYFPLGEYGERVDLSGDQVKQNSSYHHPVYIFHGTSDKHLDSIRQQGLKAGSYLATNAGTAHIEAVYTTGGDPYSGDSSIIGGGLDEVGKPRVGIGGNPVVLAIPYAEIANHKFREDVGYVQGDDEPEYTVISEDRIPITTDVKVLTSSADMKAIYEEHVRTREYNTDFTKLEDRLLVLRDKVDVLQKEFDPNQPRDKDGKWTDIGGTVLEHVRSATGWLSTTRISEAVNQTFNQVRANPGPVAKEALSHAVAWAMSYHSKSGSDYDAVQASVSVLADKMEVSQHQAREYLSGAILRLKNMRSKTPDLEKAKKDPIIEQADKMLEILDSLDLDDKEPVKKVFDPNQPRDKDGKWGNTGGGVGKEEMVNNHPHVKIAFKVLLQDVMWSGDWRNSFLNKTPNLFKLPTKMEDGTSIDWNRVNNFLSKLTTRSQLEGFVTGDAEKLSSAGEGLYAYNAVLSLYNKIVISDGKDMTQKEYEVELAEIAAARERKRDKGKGIFK